MAMNRSANNCGAAVRAAAFIIIVLAAATSMVEQSHALGKDPSAIQEETVTVSCFKGNLDEGNFIGSLTVTSPQDAGRSCNSFYYDCQGECMGCVTNPNGFQVCYDNEGKKITK
jgi:hypothetical protein